MNRDWNDRLTRFCLDHEHPAWGFAHVHRVFRLSLDLAKFNGDEIDWPAIRAASLIHDLGAVEPFRQEGRDHTEVALEKAPEWLGEVGFPADKVELVKTIIAGHMFYADPGPQAEAIHFHDADVLDFMGYIGLTRLLAVCGRSDLAPNLISTVERIERFSRELPGRLHTEPARRMGEVRLKEMEAYLKGLAAQTGGFHVL